MQRFAVAGCVLVCVGLGLAWTFHARSSRAVVDATPTTGAQPPEPGVQHPPRTSAAPGAISGEVTDPAGGPLADSRIEAYPVTPDALDERWRLEHTVVAYSAADGSFRFDDLPAGRHFVAATAPGYCGAGQARLQCETGDEFLKFELVRCAGVSGRVFASDGYPLANVTLRVSVLETPPDSHITRGSYQTLATTNSSGRFTFESVPFGKVELTATHPREGAKAVTLHLAEGEHLDGVDLYY